MSAPISILLVDDQELLRMGFRMVLDAQPDMRVVGEADNGLAAVQQAQQLQPDVVLMDVRMPELDGVEATRRISAALPATRVLILTTFDLDEYVMTGLRAGASGFLLKDVVPPDLLSAIRAVAAGDAVVAPAVTRRLLDRYVRGQGHLVALMPPWTRSRPASTRYSSWSPEHCPTPRSLGSCFCPRRQSRPTSRGSWPSWDCGTGCRRSCEPTSPASSDRGTPEPPAGLDAMPIAETGCSLNR